MPEVRPETQFLSKFSLHILWYISTKRLLTCFMKLAVVGSVHSVATLQNPCDYGFRRLVDSMEDATKSKGKSNGNNLENGRNFVSLP